jgi:hypothetical protein
MHSIRKYLIIEPNFVRKVTTKMPKGAKVLKIQCINHKWYFWALVDLMQQMEDRAFYVAHAYSPIPQKIVENSIFLENIIDEELPYRINLYIFELLKNN